GTRQLVRRGPIRLVADGEKERAARVPGGEFLLDGPGVERARRIDPKGPRGSTIASNGSTRASSEPVKTATIVPAPSRKRRTSNVRSTGFTSSSWSWSPLVDEAGKMSGSVFSGEVEDATGCRAQRGESRRWLTIQRS